MATLYLPAQNYSNYDSSLPQGLTTYSTPMPGLSVPITAPPQTTTASSQSGGPVLGVSAFTSNATQQQATADATQRNAVNSVYDSRIGRLQNLFNTIPTQQDNALNTYNAQFDANMGALNNSLNTGRANLDFQASQNEQQKVRSFRDIAQGIRNTMESAANRLGTMNATDSSASPMLAYALANLQAQQRGQANDTFNTNSQQIGLARNNMETEFNTQMGMLNAEKKSRIQEIADRYTQIRQQITDQIAQSDEARAFELANLGQQYTMRALADIQNLENEYSQASQSWVQNALSAMPRVNTQPFSNTPEMQGYGTYGRGTAVDGGVQTANDSIALSPLRRLQELA